MLATLNKAKAFMGVSEEDDSQDLTILSALAAASAAIERECNRSFEHKLYRQTLDGSGTQFLRLRNYPVESVSLLKVDGKEEDADSFTIEPENGMLFRRSGWPQGARLVEVEYLAGYTLPSDETGAEPATLPENIQLACIMLAQILLRSPGVKSERVGDISVTYDEAGLPAVVKSLLRL
ncbi:hypothetical protein E6C60_2583 [Paenibacillus algicola]|uniref:Phage gp6-like head-tail connector protein n=1 Tax=Paenibacillus algicola TaxID=2565926 RepID=A0A4P8XLV6_9BACL|nr:hypothetical protein [Paenibacillus algicola]QCT03295.1 hypothetical protein E6C60_2583 [Paenibacillus algicola]